MRSFKSKLTLQHKFKQLLSRSAILLQSEESTLLDLLLEDKSSNLKKRIYVPNCETELFNKSSINEIRKDIFHGILNDLFLKKNFIQKENKIRIVEDKNKELDHATNISRLHLLDNEFSFDNLFEREKYISSCGRIPSKFFNRECSKEAAGIMNKKDQVIFFFSFLFID